MHSVFTLQSQRVVFPDGERPARLVIADGRVAAIHPIDGAIEGSLVDHGALAILPGLLDTHVHFNEPGRTEWEGWASGTSAALAGGVTTVVEMPLNSIPSTVDPESLKLKIDSTLGKLFCDVGLWGGAVPGNRNQLKPLAEAGVLGFKSFMSDPGTAEFRNLDREGLRQAMQEVAALDSVLLLHAEWPEALNPSPEGVDPYAYRSWLETRPVAAEREAIKVVTELAKETGCRCHIVHVASHEALEPLENTPLTCETCAHYLVFAAEEIPDRATQFKCAPPIRQAAHREGLWKALAEGRIQMITSDHSPCTPALKSENFLTSWGGISGVAMLLVATWTGAKERGHSLSEVARWLAEEPAKLAGLSHDRGSIEVGKLAHLVVFDPDSERRVDRLPHRYPGSAYEGRTWRGVVEATYLRGARVFDGASVDPQPKGQMILAAK